MPAQRPRLASTGRARLATAIAVVAWALAVVATCLLVVGRPPVNQELWFFAVDVSVAGVYGTVAAVTLSRRSHPVAWLLGLVAIGGGLAAFGYGYDVWALLPGGGPPNEQIALLQSTAWVPGTLALFLVVPWLVRDHPLGWEWVGLAAGAALVVELHHRFGPEEERNGLGWLAVGTALTAVAFVPVLSPWTWLPYWLTPIIHLLSQTVFPAAILVVGARGYLLKSASPAEVERGIRAVANGEAILGPQVASRAMATLTSGRTAVRVPFPELSDREREVLDLLARGYDNATIARRMVLSPKTVRNHVSNVLTKLGIPDRAQAMIKARDEGLGGDQA
jgi:DNA-binding CsgD family transcriptional regulator